MTPNGDRAANWSDPTDDSTGFRTADSEDSILRFKTPPKFQISIRKRQYLDPGNPQLSILDLMAITAICAVTISTTIAFGFGSVYVLLIGCGAANMIMAGQLKDEPVQFRFWNQFTWGILVPLICIFNDPMVFGQFRLGMEFTINDYGYACYAFIAWQMLFLIFSWLVPQQFSWQNKLVAGTLMAGAGFSLAVGLCLLPLTLAATLMFGIGLPGFVPWLTGTVYLRTALMHLQRNDVKEYYANELIVILGLLLAIAIGVATHVILMYLVG